MSVALVGFVAVGVIGEPNVLLALVVVGVRGAPSLVEDSFARFFLKKPSVGIKSAIRFFLGHGICKSGVERPGDNDLQQLQPADRLVWKGNSLQLGGTETDEEHF